MKSLKGLKIEMKKLALFDLDGTLFNTDDVNYYSYSKALSDYGYNIDYNYYCNFCNGRRYTEFLPKIINDESIVKKVHDLKKEYYSQFLNKARINSGLFDIIRVLKKDYYIVIVTTASLKNTLDILKYFKVETLFDDIISQEDVNNPKPDPEGFLKAMSKYDKKGIETIIFEDSDVGIEAALKTEASVYKVIDFK